MEPGTCTGSATVRCRANHVHRQHRPSGKSDLMSNGVHAKRGFNYQDIVTLDLLLAHFGKHGASATVRPEGVDDLELSWRDSEGTILTQFVQVKKPREDRATNPTKSSLDTSRHYPGLDPRRFRASKGKLLAPRLGTRRQSLFGRPPIIGCRKMRASAEAGTLLVHGPSPSATRNSLQSTFRP